MHTLREDYHHISCRYKSSVRKIESSMETKSTKQVIVSHDSNISQEEFHRWTGVVFTHVNIVKATIWSQATPTQMYL